MYQLHLGDCLAVLKTLPDNSIDSIVTDPPYGLSFMGKKWDYDVPSAEVWAECLRVLKPGGHLLAFAGTRTQHRMAVRIEDAGFEIRDMIAWVYGSGFPKSMDVSKALDKAAGAEREVIGSVRRWGANASGGRGSQNANGYQESAEGAEKFDPITAPATDAAKQWQGWGTALKPALEPITVARKPLTGTVAANVLEYGTGALNIDGCRVDAEDGGRPLREVAALRDDVQYSGNALVGRIDGSLGTSKAVGSTDKGRWPANLIHDGSEEVVALFPANAGAAAPVKGTESSKASTGNITGERERVAGAFHADKGSAARFFYCAKTSKKDREEGLDSFDDRVLAFSNQARAQLERGIVHDGDKYNKPVIRKNDHPTVKPTDLMRYLCRLVTPPNGTVLDPFMGSGSTGKAAVLEGFNFTGIEREAEYFAIAEARIAHAAAQKTVEQAKQQDLFV